MDKSQFRFAPYNACRLEMVSPLQAYPCVYVKINLNVFDILTLVKYVQRYACFGADVGNTHSINGKSTGACMPGVAFLLRYVNSHYHTNCNNLPSHLRYYTRKESYLIDYSCVTLHTRSYLLCICCTAGA